MCVVLQLWKDLFDWSNIFSQEYIDRQKREEEAEEGKTREEPPSNSVLHRRGKKMYIFHLVFRFHRYLEIEEEKEKEVAERDNIEQRKKIEK